MVFSALCKSCAKVSLTGLSKLTRLRQLLTKKTNQLEAYLHFALVSVKNKDRNVKHSWLR